MRGNPNEASEGTGDKGGDGGCKMGVAEMVTLKVDGRAVFDLSGQGEEEAQWGTSGQGKNGNSRLLFDSYQPSFIAKLRGTTSRFLKS